jgi:hypothetical protein
VVGWVALRELERSVYGTHPDGVHVAVGKNVPSNLVQVVSSSVGPARQSDPMIWQQGPAVTLLVPHAPVLESQTLPAGPMEPPNGVQPSGVATCVHRLVPWQQLSMAATLVVVVLLVGVVVVATSAATASMHSLAVPSSASHVPGHGPSASAFAMAVASLLATFARQAASTGKPASIARWWHFAFA